MYAKKLGMLNAALLPLIALAGWLLQGQMAQAQLNAHYVPTINNLFTPHFSYLTDASGNQVMTDFVYGFDYDTAGNLYVSDGGTSAAPDGVIYKVNAATGQVSVFAGQPNTFNSSTSTVTPGAICTPANTPGAQFIACGDTSSATASTALLNAPGQLVFDNGGNAYFIDSGNHRVRKVSAGILSTVIGTGQTSSNTPSGSWASNTYANALNINLATPSRGLAIGTDLNSGHQDLYISDGAYVDLYDISTGLMTRYAGGGTGSPNVTAANAVPATSVALPAAAFTTPSILATDSAGNLYVVDGVNSVVYQITPNGSNTDGSPKANIHVFAGTYANSGYSGDGFSATSAKLTSPVYVSVDTANNVYILTSGAVRKVTPLGVISTVVGSGSNTGTANLFPAVGTTIQNTIKAMAVSPDMSQMVLGYANNTNGSYIRVVYSNNGFPPTPSPYGSQVTGLVAVGANYTTPAIKITTPVSGTFITGISAQATTAGTATHYQIDPTFPADFSMTALTTTTPSPTAGVAPVTPTFPVSMTPWEVLTGQVTFKPTAPGLRTSRVMLTDSTNANYYLGIYGVGQSSAAAFTPGTISEYAGAAGTVVANLSQPSAVALDAANNLYIVDAGTGTVSKASAGTIAPIATGLTGAKGIAVDATGNVFIADTAHNCIQEVSANTGATSPVPGTCGTLSSPAGVAVDGPGNLYIADTGNNVIREVGVYSGVMSTIVGASAGLTGPTSLAVDSQGNLFIADTGNNQIREFSNGVLSTVVSVTAPTAIAVDAAGNIYVTGYNLVNLVSPAGLITQIAGGGSQAYAIATPPIVSTNAKLSAPSGIAVDQYGNYYIADTINSSIALVKAATPTMVFGTTAAPITAGNTNIQTISLLNIGNQTLNPSRISISGTAFTLTGGTCVAGTQVSIGGSCTITVTFTPTVNGLVTGTVTVTDDALNTAGSTQTINLTGVGYISSGPNQVIVVSGDNQSVNPLGSFAPLLVKVVDVKGINVPDGQKVTFTIVDGTPATGITFSTGLTSAQVSTVGGIATAPALIAGLTRGNFTVTATDTLAVTTPTATFSNLSISGAIMPTLTVTTIPTGSLVYGQSVTATATLTIGSLGTATAATGTVTLYDNGTAVGTGTVANGVATVTYTPTSVGSHTLTANFTSSNPTNYANSTATAGNLLVTPLAITATITSVSLPYGSALPTFTGILSGVLTVDVPNVQLVVKSSTGTTTPDAGTYALSGSLTGSAAGNYTLTVLGTPTLIITQAITTTTLISSNSQPGIGTTVTLTAVVASQVSNVYPIGTVVFYDGTTSLGPAVAVSGGKATLSLSSLPLGAQSLTSVFTPTNGADYASSTSPVTNVTVIAPDFNFTFSVTNAVIQQGASLNDPITVTGNPAFSGTFTFGCTGLPANSTCVFTPQIVTLPTTQTPPSLTAAVLLQITTAGSAATSSFTGENRTPSRSVGITFAAIFLPGILFGGLMGRRRLNRDCRTLLSMAVIAIGLSAAGLVSGCGSGFTSANNVQTPLGPASVIITATATSSSGTITHTQTVAINVVAK